MLVFNSKSCFSSENLAANFDYNVDRILTGDQQQNPAILTEEDSAPIDQEVLVDFDGNVLTKEFD